LYKPKLDLGVLQNLFDKLDSNGNGTIEFDEFVTWLSEDEVRLQDALGHKESFEELALDHDEPLALIMRLHDKFSERLPNDMEDKYPTQPAKLNKDAALAAIEALNPMERQNIESRWDLVDVDGSCEGVYFDEFLEMLDFAELPAELRANLHSSRRRRRSSEKKKTSSEPSLGVIHE